MLMSRQDGAKLMDAVTLAATRTATFGAAGCDSITLGLVHTNSAATAIQYYLEWSPDAGTTWLRWTGTDDAVVAGTPDTLTQTVVRRAWENAEPASLTSWATNAEGVFHSNMRLTVTSTAGAAGDLLTCYLVRHFRH